MACSSVFSLPQSSVMWIPKRNQHLIRTSIPTAAGYESSTYPSPEGAAPWTFSDQYVWVGTQAFDAYLSISRALDFRALCGGEERIMRWCVDLAEEGGQRLSKVLGGREIMRVGQDPLGCAMVSRFIFSGIFRDFGELMKARHGRPGERRAPAHGCHAHLCCRQSARVLVPGLPARPQHLRSCVPARWALVRLPALPCSPFFSGATS